MLRGFQESQKANGDDDDGRWPDARWMQDNVSVEKIEAENKIYRIKVPGHRLILYKMLSFSISP